MSARTNVRSFPGDLEADDVSVAVSTDIPAVSSVINSTNIGTTFLVGANPTVSTTNKLSPGEGVNFNFTVPRGDTGEVVIGQVSGGTTPSVTRNGTSTSATLDFVLPKGTDATTYFTQSGDDISYTTGNVGVGAAPPTGKKLYVDGTLGVEGVDLNSDFVDDYDNITLNSSRSTQVAISGDGNTIVIGTNLGGRFYLYRYNTTTKQWYYVDETSLSGRQIYSIAISYDGSRAITGFDYGDLYGYNLGSSIIRYIFINSSNNTFANKLDISGDGNRAIVSERTSRKAYMYHLFNSTPVATFSESDAGYAFSVAISRDGNTACVSSVTSANTNKVFVYRYNTSSSQWDTTAEDSFSQNSDNDFGTSVSISDNGNIICVGADASPCKVYIYRYINGTWSNNTNDIINEPPSGVVSNFGFRVSISGDGNTFIVAATGTRKVYIYKYDGSGWDIFKEFEESAVNNFGNSVDISYSGNQAVIGANASDKVYTYNRSTVLDVSTPIQADGSLLSFTGQHICTPHGPMEQGLIVSANKNAYTTLNGPLLTGSRAIQSSESLPVVSLSDRENDPYVFGVVDHVEGGGTERVQDRGGIIVRKTKTPGDDRVIVNSLGEGAIWVVDAGGPLVSGDLISTSSVPGYGQRQSDDTFRNYTVAKITMDCDFNPPDIPVQVATTDDNGNLKWEDTGETEKAYKTKTVEVGDSGVVYTAAYVGCTYHCG